MKPILFHLFHEPIYSYPLLMGLGWGAGYNITASLWRQENLPPSLLKLFFITSFLLAWIGAKVFFLVFSTPEKALDYSQEINFWMGGGFVFYGGLIFAGTFAALLFKFHPKLSLGSLGLITPGLTLGHAIGRVGCFLAGCCFGDQCDLPIGVTLDGVSRHPVQLYEVAGLLTLFILLKRLWRRGKSPGQLLAAYMTLYSLLRLFNEFFRGDSIRGIYYGLSTSQWISILVLVGGLTLWGRLLGLGARQTQC